MDREAQDHEPRGVTVVMTSKLIAFGSSSPAGAVRYGGRLVRWADGIWSSARITGNRNLHTRQRRGRSLADGVEPKDLL